MTIKKLLCTFVILCTSSSAFASLIRVDFDAEFATTPSSTTIEGWFQYDDTTKLLTDISLEILGVVHSTTTVGFDLDASGPNHFLLGGLINGFGSVSSLDKGDFFLSQYGPLHDTYVMLYATGNGNVATQNVVATRSITEVPEPSTIGIFALGLIGLAARRFKKQS